MPRPSEDLNTSGSLKRLDDLETFRKEFEGKEFDKKVLNSITDSKPIQDEIKKISWQTMREKIVWIILGGIGVIFIDLLIRSIPHIIKAISG